MNSKTISAWERDLEQSSHRSKRLRAALGLFEHYYYTDTIIAKDYAEQALRLASATKKAEDLARAHIALGRALWRMADYDEGFTHFKTARSLITTLGNDELRRQVLYLIGNSHLVKAEYPEAVEAYVQSLALAKQSHDSLSEQIILNNLGILYTRIGDYERAFLYHSESLRIGIKINDPEIGSGYLNLGIIRYHQKQPDEAMRYFQTAKENFTKHDNWFGLIKAELDIGNILLEEKKYSEAEHAYTNALELSTRQGFHAETVRLLHRLGDLALERKDPRSAMKYFERSLELSRRIKSPSDEAYALFRKAAAERKLRKITQAKRSIDEALNICTEIGEFRTAYEVHRLAADLAKSEGDADAAVAHLEEYIRLKDACFKHDREQEVRDEELRLKVTEAAQEREQTIEENRELRKQLDTKELELKESALTIMRLTELINKIERSRKHTADSHINEVNDLLKLKDTALPSVTTDDPVMSKRLLEHAPDLTPKELKVCLLMRKDLNTKDIAAMLFSSHRTVEVHRLNIRKKLRLKKNEDLKTAL